jgi:hypothetical protein
MRALLVKLPFACASVRLKRFGGMAAGTNGSPGTGRMLVGGDTWPKVLRGHGLK